MLLSLFKLTMIVSLLISAVCIEANEKSPSEKEKAVVESSERQDALPKGDTQSVDGHNEDSLVQKRQSSKHSKYSTDQDPRARRGSVRSTEHRISRADDKTLAHKMAKEALRSPKMQETIKKLSRVTKPHTTLYASVKLPLPGRTGVKKTRNEHKQGMQKERRKKKRKRHHRRFRNGHADWPKRGSSKKTSNTDRVINASVKKLTRQEKSISKHHNRDESQDKPSTSKPNEKKVTHVQVEDSDYVDFSSPLNTKSSELPSKPPKREAKLHDSEKMIESLMRTTTRNPSKKSPGDQGIEYSDYYSDDDVLQDIAANKIPMQVVEPKNLNDRFARQAANTMSVRRLDRNVQPYQRNRVTRRRDLRYTGDAVRHFHRLHKYPKRFTGMNRNFRFPGSDDCSSGYVSYYKPTDDRYEQLDPMYPISTEEALEQPEIPEKEAVLDLLENDLDVSGGGGSDDEIQQQNPDQYNYLNQYEVPQEGDFNGMNTNDNVDLQNEISQLPKRFDSSELQNVQNYRPMDRSLQRVENVDQSMMNQAQIENMRLSGTTDNIDALPQPSFSAIQSYDNPDMDQAEKSIQMQEANNLPQLSANNAMNQPFGKVLQSLGINVNTDSSNSNQNASLENVNAGMDDPVLHPNTLDRPEERLLSPSYLKQEIKDQLDQTNGMNNENEWNHRIAGFRNENRPGYSRKQFYKGNPPPPAHHMNISIAVQDTKEIANQILDTIMEELEELKLDHTKGNRREGLPCRLSGSWSTSQAGMKLDMRVVNRSIIATVSELTTPRFHGSLLNGTWNVSGHAPFKRGAPFTLIATDTCSKSIAVFVGACRVCEGVDTIAGVWSVARQSKDCRDIQVATSVFNDIFRKTKLSSLRENQNSTTAASVTLKHDKRKS